MSDILLVCALIVFFIVIGVFIHWCDVQTKIKGADKI